MWDDQRNLEGKYRSGIYLNSFSAICFLQKCKVGLTTESKLALGAECKVGLTTESKVALGAECSDLDI